MGFRISSIPAPGLRTVNSVGSVSGNIDLVSPDSSVGITTGTEQIQLVVNPVNINTGLILPNVPCDVSVYVGSAVILTAGTAFNAIATSISTSNVAGIVVSKPDSTHCDIRVSGITPGIFVGLNEAFEYFLSATTPGGITTTPPTGPGQVLLKLGQPFSATEFIINKGDRFVRG